MHVYHYEMDVSTPLFEAVKKDLEDVHCKIENDYIDFGYKALNPYSYRLFISGGINRYALFLFLRG